MSDTMRGAIRVLCVVLMVLIGWYVPRDAGIPDDERHRYFPDED